MAYANMRDNMPCWKKLGDGLAFWIFFPGFTDKGQCPLEKGYLSFRVQYVMLHENEKFRTQSFDYRVYVEDELQTLKKYRKNWLR